MPNKILIISAHPDDEVLGCGGAIANHSLKGDLIDQLFISDGESSRHKTSKNLHKPNCNTDYRQNWGAAVMLLFSPL